MTREEVYNILKGFNLPLTYYEFPDGTAPALPYAVFYYPSTVRQETADDKLWTNVYQLNVELYTANKDFAKESAVEAILESNGFVYMKSETYLEKEHMYEVLYEMEVILNG